MGMNLFGFLFLLPSFLLYATGEIDASQSNSIEHEGKSCRRLNGFGLAGYWDKKFEFHLKQCDLIRYTPQMARTCLANKTTVMMGQSVTRYQFLSLLEFLKFDRYPVTRAKEDVCFERTWSIDVNKTYEWIKPDINSYAKMWANFFYQSTQKMDGRALCDCSRTSATSRHQEARFYRDETNGMELMYFQTSGGKNVFGNVGLNQNTLNFETAKEFLEKHCPLPGTCYPPFKFDLPLESFFPKIISKVAPDNLIYSNEMSWLDHHKGANTEGDAHRKRQVLSNAIETIKRGGRAFYKTSTFNRGDLSRNSYKVEASRDSVIRGLVANATLTGGSGGVQGGWGIFDVTMIQKALYDKNRANATTSYYDSWHPHCFVYKEFNNMLLNLLCNE